MVPRGDWQCVSATALLTLQRDADVRADLAENVRHEWTLDSYTFATQLVQAEAMSSAIRSWMRNYRGPRRYATAGALVWQLNDVWPATSWALVDYFVRPKGAVSRLPCLALH